MKPSEHPGLVVYGVVGLKRGWGGTQGIGSAGSGRQKRAVLISQSVTFDGPDGGTVTITSRHPSDDEQFEHVRAWAPMNPYLASPRGLAARAAWDRSTPIPRPGDVDWVQITILVDGQDSPFQMCDLGDGYWAAVGRVPDATVTIDGRRVPISDVRLERLSSRNPPPLASPDIGERTETVMQSLDDRFARVPFRRVQHRADYWALRAIEIDHVNRLAHRVGLSRHQLEALEPYWLSRIEAPLRETLDRLRFRHIDALHRSRIARHLGSGALFQLWFNTFGPGAKTWFGNRYVHIRHYTFRLRWRP